MRRQQWGIVDRIARFTARWLYLRKITSRHPEGIAVERRSVRQEWAIIGERWKIQERRKPIPKRTFSTCLLFEFNTRERLQRPRITFWNCLIVNCFVLLRGTRIRATSYWPSLWLKYPTSLFSPLSTFFRATSWNSYKNKNSQFLFFSSRYIAPS